MDYKAIDYKNIPVQADIIAGIIRLDADSTSCFHDLDSYVSSDQGVATLVLRVVNSPLYSRGKKIATVPMAISVLGFNVVRSLAMLAFSRALFSQTKNDAFRVHIWQHSLLTAIAAQVICRTIASGKPGDEVFIAGLMHDVGKVLMFTHDQTRYLAVLAELLERGGASVDVEQRVFSCSHCDVGAEAVRQWNLPERFVDYMGTDLSRPRPEYAGDPIRLGLAAGNALIGSVGIGAKASKDLEARKRVLMSFGLDEALCGHWLNDEFVPNLMQEETYQLFATL